MEDSHYFLGEGRATVRGPEIKAALSEALSTGERRTPLGRISEYIEGFRRRPRTQEEIDGRFRIPAMEIVLSKTIRDSCCDTALAFIVLAREGGIPTRYVETFLEDNLKNSSSKNVEGHVFTEILFHDQWWRYEPIKGFTPKLKFYFGNKRYVEFGKGLDYTEIYKKISKDVYETGSLDLSTFSSVKEARDGLSKIYNN